MYVNLAILAAFVFIYSMVAGRIEKMPISGPIVFTAFGVMTGPLGLGILELHVDMEGLRTIAELTLALVLEERDPELAEQIGQKVLFQVISP